MLRKAQEHEPPLLSGSTYAFAEGIKEYGDKGAHRQDIAADEARVVIFTTLKVLKGLFEGGDDGL